MVQSDARSLISPSRLCICTSKLARRGVNVCRESCGTTFDGNRKQATKEMLQAKTASKDWTTLTTVAAPTSAASCTTSRAACNGSRLSSSNKTIHLPSASTNKGAHKQLCNAAWEMRWLGAQSSHKSTKQRNCWKIVWKFCQNMLCLWQRQRQYLVQEPGNVWLFLMCRRSVCACVCRGQCCMAQSQRLWGVHICARVGGLRSFPFSRCFLWHSGALIVAAACRCATLLLFGFCCRCCWWRFLFLCCSRCFSWRDVTLSTCSRLVKTCICGMPHGRQRVAFLFALRLSVLCELLLLWSLTTPMAQFECCAIECTHTHTQPHMGTYIYVPHWVLYEVLVNHRCDTADWVGAACHNF